MFKFFMATNYDSISLQGSFLTKSQEKFIFLLQNA
jgi:F420-dependent methylenetetrahydromethanopterin dehydrogenase